MSEKPLKITIEGPIGSGKSRLAATLIPILGLLGKHVELRDGEHHHVPGVEPTAIIVVKQC